MLEANQASEIVQFILPKFRCGDFVRLLDSRVGTVRRRTVFVDGRAPSYEIQLTAGRGAVSAHEDDLRPMREAQ
jgi:hypothetical protein